MIRTAILLTLLAAAPALAEARADKGDGIAWQKSYAAGLKLAQQTAKPMMIDFWATWCGPCKEMDREVWPEPKVVEATRRFVCVSIDIDRDQSTTARYAVRAFPTMIFTDPWGNELGRHIGSLRAPELVRGLQGLPGDFSAVTQWIAVLDKNGQDVDALGKLASFYAKAGALILSNRYYERALKTETARANDELREAILIDMGLNYLLLRNFGDARKFFERCVKEFPNGRQCDKALLGVLTAQLQQGKVGDAEKTFAQLKAKYPDSPSTQMAASNLAKMRGRVP